ncbi:MAG TPA: four helix bundle protein [Deltaproteobacteria bacterium]|nr:four helix bundle protein [Deltaproteobacteria bacterium]
MRHFALGSLYELQTRLEILKNLAYLLDADFDEHYESSREVERMLVALIHKIKDSTRT